jgi:hypothetical protein
MIFVVPAATPVTTPVVALSEFTVATLASLVLQMPPVDASVSVVFAPAHTESVPVIGDIAFTVIGYVALHPVGSVYVTVNVPEVIPVVIPVAEPIVARPALLDIHDPPALAEVNTADDPIHTMLSPVTEAGNGLTVTVVV